MLTNRFTLAVDYAAIVHAGQVRKGTDIPYLSHLLAVAGLVLEHGGDEDLAIAGLLHDAAEDQGGRARLADIRMRFGERVAGIVAACSDSLSADADRKAPWVERKRDYLDHLRAAADSGYLLVSCADKLHNARAIVQDLRTHGKRLWPRFTDKGDKSEAQIVGYYAALADAFDAVLPERLRPLARELRLTVEQLLAESGIAPERAWERRR
jgi:(p)ppGpp synthase/HD superfamily hydrolase